MSTQHLIRDFAGPDVFRIEAMNRDLFNRIDPVKQRSLGKLAEKDKPDLNDHLKNQREQIARDLHDGIGSQLTHIISRIEIIAYNNKSIEPHLLALRDFTIETVQQLRETIWVLNQVEIEYGHLAERLRGLLTRISADIDFPKIKITAYGDASLLLAPQMASSIFRIVQEAVNNAMKYADATAITVCLATDQNSLTVLVTDNGRGFAASDVSLGYGLLNMKKRAEELDGTLKITSSPEGTNIIVEFPLPM